jgi:hypothetical protein
MTFGAFSLPKMPYVPLGDAQKLRLSLWLKGGLLDVVIATFQKFRIQNNH